MDFKLLSFWKKKKVPEAQTVKSILKSTSRKSTPGLEKRVSFNPIVYNRTQIIHDNSLEEKNQSNRIAFQQNQEAIVAENQFNQFTKEFTERTHQLTAKSSLTILKLNVSF